MKASEFKQLIKEAVKEAVKEELLEILQQPLQEQVKYQDDPVPPVEKTKPVKTGNAVLDALNETRYTMNSEDYRNITGNTLQSSLAQAYDRSMFFPKQNIKPVSDDPRAVAQAVASAPKTGLDLSQLSFVNKAAAIVNLSDKKQKEKYGV